MRAPTDQPRRRRRLLVPGMVTLSALPCSYRSWHLAARAQSLEGGADRHADTQRLAATPGDLPTREDFPRLNAGDDEFRRVRLRATSPPGQEALVYTSGSALRSDVSGPGYWVFALGAACRRQHGGGQSRFCAGGPSGPTWPARRAAGRNRRRDALARAACWFTPSDDPARNLWFVRDHRAIAAARAGAKWRLSSSIRKRRCRRAGCRARDRSTSTCATTTCNTRSLGSYSRGHCLSFSRCGRGGGSPSRHHNAVRASLWASPLAASVATAGLARSHGAGLEYKLSQWVTTAA